jgi:hypothetical protein
MSRRINDLIFYVPHDMTERQQRHWHQLHVLYREWNAYDCEAQQDATQNVTEED